MTPAITDADSPKAARAGEDYETKFKLNDRIGSHTFSVEGYEARNHTYRPSDYDVRISMMAREEDDRKDYLPP